MKHDEVLTFSELLSRTWPMDVREEFHEVPQYLALEFANPPKPRVVLLATTPSCAGFTRAHIQSGNGLIRPEEEHKQTRYIIRQPGTVTTEDYRRLCKFAINRGFAALLLDMAVTTYEKEMAATQN